MFQFRQQILNLTPKYVRSIKQFRLPLTDCCNKDFKKPTKIKSKGPCEVRDRGLVLGVYYNDKVARDRTMFTEAAKAYDDLSGGKLSKLLKLSETPRLGETRVFFDVMEDEYAFVAVAGLGSECLTCNVTEKRDDTKEAIRVAAGSGATALQEYNPIHIDVESFGDAEAAAEGAALAVWEFREYKSPPKTPPIPIRPTLKLYRDCDELGWEIGLKKAESQNLARFLQEMPANLLNPTEFAKVAVDLLAEMDINVEVKTQGWAKSHKMGGFVSIGNSSVQPPLYVEISYFGADEKVRPIVLIGKGVTFDSGSLDLKSCEDLRYMKGDMAGAAVVVAVTRAAARLKMPVNIRGILPLCELMPSGKSPKFGEVVDSANGKTIHIRLPSREGRLLIADSLVYARNYWPKFIIDVGTMSEELRHTLGNAACGCYANSEKLFAQTEEASCYTGDRIWRMPLWKFYEDRILDCRTADLANVGKHRFGDSPNCAAFLKQFVCDSEWVHFDTYNVAYTKGTDFKYLHRGMSGRPTRTIIQLIHQLSKPPEIPPKPATY